MSAGRPILCEIVEQTAWITINRCLAHNALDRTMATALSSAWSRALTSPTVNGVVVIGAGVEAFSLGIDRSEGAVPPLDNRFTAPALGVPLVVAVNGMVCAEAMDLIRSDDTVVAAEHTRFFPERLSLSRTGGTAPLSAAQALAAGLVDHIVPIVRLRHEAKLTVRGLAAERTLTSTTSSARSQPRE